MHQTIQKYLEARQERRRISREVDRLEALLDKLPCPKQEELRRATADDIVVGAVIWSIDEITEGDVEQDEDAESDHFVQIVEEVLWKAFCAHDGCRYGLRNAYVYKEKS